MTDLAGSPGIIMVWPQGAVPQAAPVAGDSVLRTVAPPRADAVARSEGIHRNVEVGSRVRVETVTGEVLSGEVLHLTEQVLVLEVDRSGAAETHSLELGSIADLRVKTWRKSDAIVFTTLGTLAAYVAIVIDAAGAS